MSTFTPAPGAAPLARQVAAQARMEARLMLRNGEQLLLAVVIPVIVLVGGVLAAERLGLDLQGHQPVDVLTPGVLALAIMSTAFTSIAIATGFERRYGVIKRLGASPLPRSGLLLGKVLALLNVVALQLVVLVVVGLLLGWRPSLEHPAVSVGATAVAVAAGTWAFASLGLFVAGVLRAEATLALANLVYLLLMAGGAVVLPTSAYGEAAGVIAWLPSAALGDAMRAALVDARLDGTAIVILVGWAVLGTVLTARTFRWE
jgi:ABC-2 type transport system permease protein